MAAVDTRPVCDYAAKCTRRNPTHFQHFQHPDLHPRHVPASSVPAEACMSLTVPPPPLTTADAVGDIIGRCKFGCGRERKFDRDSRYDTCCRACALGQGSGSHDSGCAGGEVNTVVMADLVEEGEEATVDMQAAEVTALMLIDQALEMGVLARAAAATGQAERSAALGTEIGALLRQAADLLGESESELLPLIVMTADTGRLRGSEDLPVWLEQEINEKLLNLISELEAWLGRGRTCLAPNDGTVAEGGTGEHPDHPAQFALRILGLADDWPTDLSMREIRRRYISEAFRTHPDKGDAKDQESRTEEFQRIATAYSTLEVYMALLTSQPGAPVPASVSRVAPLAAGAEAERSAAAAAAGGAEEAADDGAKDDDASAAGAKDDDDAEEVPPPVPEGTVEQDEAMSKAMASTVTRGPPPPPEEAEKPDTNDFEAFKKKAPKVASGGRPTEDVPVKERLSAPDVVKDKPCQCAMQ